MPHRESEASYDGVSLLLENHDYNNNTEERI